MTRLGDRSKARTRSPFLLSYEAYLLVLSDAVEAEKVRAVAIFALDEIIDALRASALMAVVKSEVARLFPVLPRGPISYLNRI